MWPKYYENHTQGDFSPIHYQELSAEWFAIAGHTAIDVGTNETAIDEQNVASHFYAVARYRNGLRESDYDHG